MRKRSHRIYSISNLASSAVIYDHNPEVHFCYGDELGLTTDDEDYIPPNNEDDKLTVGQRLSVESIIEDVPRASLPTLFDQALTDESFELIKKITDDETNEEADIPTKIEPIRKISIIHTSSESETDKITFRRRRTTSKPTAKCESMHEGREFVNTIIPMYVDKLFTLIFTSSKFIADFNEFRKTTKYSGSEWTENERGQKLRTLTYTVSLNATVGPKSCDVTETQVLTPQSKAGELYSINIESLNANVPYADSFYCETHYCLIYVNEGETRLQVFSQVKYKKSVWGLVKSMIEKNCYAGMEEYFQMLLKSLTEYKEESIAPIPQKRKAPRPPRRRSAIPTTESLLPTQLSDLSELPEHSLNNNTILSTGVILEASNKKSAVIAVNNIIPRNNWLIFGLIFVLLILNAILYVKLWALENEYGSVKRVDDTEFDLSLLSEIPKHHNDWLKVLQEQEKFHTTKLNKWDQTLKYSIELLRKAEDSLLSLQSELGKPVISDIKRAISSIEDTLSTEENSYPNRQA